MVFYQKFASLPDLDEAPTVYETPNVAVDSQQHHTYNSRSPSPSDGSEDHHDVSPTNGEADSGEVAVNTLKSGIIRHQLKPSRARQAFGNAIVDARDVDFSDRVDGRRSYRVSARRRHGRRRTGANRVDESEDEDDDDEEDVHVRIARLMREVEEVKGQVARTDGGGADDGFGSRESALSTVGKLSEVLRSLQMQTQSSGPLSVGTITGIRAGKEGEEPDQGKHTSMTGQAASAKNTSQAEAMPDIANGMRTNPELVLSKATLLESRLAALEHILGPISNPLLSPNTSSTTSNANYSSTSNLHNNPTTSTTTSRSVLATLALLESHLTLLTTTTAPSLNDLAPRITALTTAAETLTARRLAASKALSDAESLRTRSRALQRLPYSGIATTLSTTNTLPSTAPTTATTSASAIASVQDLAAEDPDMHAKISALHAHLPTLTAVSPLLPLVLERLRSLRALHAAAGMAAERLEEVETRQGIVKKELERWREGLAGFVGAVKAGSEGTVQNRQVVEGWVRDLEARMESMALP